MPIRLACCLLMFASCTGVHVDNLTVDDPTVNIDADAQVNIDANATANVDVQPTDTGTAQPADTEKPVEAVKSPALEREPEARREPVTEVVEPEPCADSDSDGVCDTADTCPAGSDADADGTGYADGCERTLWSTTVWVLPAQDAQPEFWTPRNYVEAQPAAVAITPRRGADCRTESGSSGMFAIELPQHLGSESLVVRVERPDTIRGGKMVECLEAGVESNIVAGLNDSMGGISTFFTATTALPEGSAGAHIVYFEVHLDEYATIRASSYGTWVSAFQATVSARGY